MISNLLAYISAYLIGAIPFGIILAKFFAHVDIKTSGSKSIGATNVLRVVKETNPKLAKKLAIATFACDSMKAYLPILFAYLLGFSYSVLWTMAVLSVLGHCFSPYLKFQGGKGVATSAGAMLFFVPIELFIGLSVWYAVAKLVKISVLASLAGLITLFSLTFIIQYDMPHIHTHAPIFILTFIVLYKHIPNFKRLIKKEEKKV